VQTLRADVGQHLDVYGRSSTPRRLQHSAAHFGAAHLACLNQQSVLASSGVSVDVRFFDRKLRTAMTRSRRVSPQFVALSATNKSVTIVKADSRGIVRHLRMQVRDAFSRGYFSGDGGDQGVRDAGPGQVRRELGAVTIVILRGDIEVVQSGALAVIPGYRVSLFAAAL
jgi:hypothetical protein